jgi:Protein of unknown function (DUF2975)
MSTESSTNADECYRAIAKIGVLAEWVSVIGIVLLFGSVAYLSLDTQRLLGYLARETADIVGRPSDMMVWLAGVAALVPTILLALALWQARQLFRLYRERRIFDPTIPTILLHLGVLAAAAGAAGVLARTLVILFLTLGNPPGQRTVAIGIGTQDIMCLIVGLLLYAFAFVMKESRRIADENESFV